VAVNNVRDIGEVTIRKVVQDAGGDPDSVEFVGLAFPDMAAAVANGDVDAAWVVEPFVTVATGQGARKVVADFRRGGRRPHRGDARHHRAADRQQMALPASPPEIDVASLETVVEPMEEHRMITEAADVDALLATD
jgi:NitT/TauT family transport system substrate-binding protein